MKKIAIFVEGQTESIFLYSFIRRLAKKKQIHFALEEKNRGQYLAVSLSDIKNKENLKYFILICNCAHDEQVKSSIIERFAGLTAAGYGSIFGLRDLHPLPNSDLNRLKNGLKAGLPSASIKIAVAVREIEAWFIQEGTHFKKIHNSLSRRHLSQEFDFDYLSDSAENIEDPAKFLDKIYQSVGKTYSKKKADAEATVAALNLDRFMSLIPNKCPSAGELIHPLSKVFA